MTRHFAFVAPPKPGHVYPTLPLVTGLVARGHRVTYFCGGELLDAVAAAGATPVELVGEDTLRPDQTAGEAFEFGIEAFAGMITTMIAQADRAFSDAFARLAADPPDAVCYDVLGPLGAWLAEKLGVPGVVLVPTMAENEHFSMAAHMPPEPPGRGRAPGEVFGEIAAMTARTRAALDVPGPSRPVPMLGGRGDLNLVFVPNDFQIAGDTFDDAYRFVGPSTGPRPGGGTWQPPANGRPVLFVSLGTVFNHRPEFFARCVEAFEDSPWHVVMTVGEHVRLPKLPDNFEVGVFVPQLSVLEHATVSLCHAGMNSTMEALFYGVPLVCVPQMPEQRVNGVRVEELGFGRVFDTATPTARELRTVVDEVAGDPKIRRTVTEYGRRLRAIDGAALGADAIEELVR